MDQIAKGMSEAGKRAPEPLKRTDEPQTAVRDKVRDFAKGTAQKVQQSMKAAGQKIKGKMR